MLKAIPHIMRLCLAKIDLLLNYEKSKQMGERGRKRAFKRFHPNNFQKNVKNYTKNYTQKN